ncbi:MAG TPA: hypothetical protein VF511_10925, partial [Chthoniobacterales bacterium]
VIVVTGAVTDPTVEKIYGSETASLLRFGAMNEATRLMAPSRVRIVHKPNITSVPEAMRTLLPHLHSALDQYCSVSIERNIFRPLPGDPGLWEIRYNGGPIVTLPHIEPFKMIRSALAQPDRALKVIQLMQSLAHASGAAGATTHSTEVFGSGRATLPDIDYKGHQQDSVAGEEGLDWEQMSGMTLSAYAPVETVGGTIPIETIIGGLLDAMAKGRLGSAVEAIAGSEFGAEPLLSVPKIASDWARRGWMANAEFGMSDAPNELLELGRRLRPLLGPVKERWLIKKSNKAGRGKQSATPKKRIRVAKRLDTPEMRLARQHWKRFKNAISRRPALREFLDHMEAWVPRDPSSKGHLHYRPPAGGEFLPFWLTE